MIIDCHSHTLSPDVNQALGGPADPRLIPYQRDMSLESKEVDHAQWPTLSARFNDLETRYGIMREMRVDHQVVLPAPGQQHYWAEPALLDEISRIQNDHVARLVENDRSRMTGLGTLPLTDVDRSIAEATRAIEERGLRGFQIDTRAGAVELSDRMFDPLYERLVKLDAPLVIHPLGFSDGMRLGHFFMVNTVGQPLEEMIAINHFIFGGVLDRHPELKILIVHGGGYFPYYLGRLDHAWRYRPELRKLTDQRPSDYLKRMWYDTCVFDADVLTRLVALAGAERVMLGSDYPFDMGDPDPLAIVEKAVPDERDRVQICADTARSFFSLSV